MNCETILIVASRQDIGSSMQSLLTGSVCLKTEITLSAGEARRRAYSIHPDIAVVVGNLNDDSGVSLSQDLIEICGGVIFVTDRGFFSEAGRILEGTGVLVLCRPVSKAVFMQTINVLIGTLQKVKHLDDEVEKLKKRMDDRKIVEKAKWYLVENLEMNEAAAHRYIQKRSMDMRVSIRKIAEEIITQYETEN